MAGNRKPNYQCMFVNDQRQKQIYHPEEQPSIPQPNDHMSNPCLLLNKQCRFKENS